MINLSYEGVIIIKRVKIILAIMLLGLLVGFSNKTVISVNSKEYSAQNFGFTDVSKNAWYYDSVNEAYSRKLIAGYSSTKFAPSDKITRGQLVTILYRMEGEPSVVLYGNAFSDVKSNQYYYDAVKWAAAKDIVHGYGNTGKFGPGKPIIRQDLAVILHNYAKYKNYDYSSSTSLNSFADYNAVNGSYAEPALKWAVKLGVISGKTINGKKYLAPTSNTTRAETAAIIVNYMKVLEKSEIGTVYFDKDNYYCEAGKTFSTKITAGGISEPAVRFGTVNSYSSSDTSIATIEKHPTLSVNCMNCTLVQVTCKKKGNVTLSATSSLGAKTTVNLDVTEGTGSIDFDQDSYTCKEGETITTKITALGTPSVIAPTVKSYTSSDTSVATIQKHPTLAVNCINCTAVQISCKKAGNSTLTTTSSLGAVNTAKVTVYKDPGTISFSEDSYTCHVGETINAKITATPYNSRVKSFYSDNSSIASIEEHPTLQVNCINCRMSQITCNAVGETSVWAESTTGAKGGSTVKVIN